MTIQFYLSNIPLPAVAHAAVERKLLGILKLNRALVKAQVDISKDRHHKQGEVFRVEINITPITGSSVRGVATGQTIIAAAHEVIAKLERQLSKKKEKRVRRR